jgi:hypothetical protein
VALAEGSDCRRVLPDKNDPNDACPVAVAALRSPACHQVRAGDAVVLRVWSRRHRQLSSLRTQAACPP